MKLISKKEIGSCHVYDIEVDQVHNFYANGINVHNCATAGGISLIKHNGTVVNSGSASSYNFISLSNWMLAAARTVSGVWYWGADSTAANLAPMPPNNLVAGFNLSSNSDTDVLDFNRGLTSKLIATQRQNFLRAPTSALVQKLRNNESAITKGIAATITNTYNTGMQIGDIRRTYIGETGSVAAGPSTELLSIGTFDSGTDWTITPGYGITISGGSLNFDGVTVIPNTELVLGSVALSITAGVTYKVKLIGTVSGAFSVRLGNTDTSAIPGFSNSIVVDITPIVTNGTLALQKRSVTGALAGSIESISIIGVYVSDRSYKNSYATITGTLTKAPVA